MKRKKRSDYASSREISVIESVMDCADVPPQSVFNTQKARMVQFLEDQYQKHQRGEDTSVYPHQVEAVRRLLEYFDPQVQSDPNASNIALVVLPTGCGKTGVAVLASYALNASRVLVITPSIIISRQVAVAYGKKRNESLDGSFLIKRKIIPNTPEKVQLVLPTVSLIEKSTEIHDGMRSMVMVVNAHKIGNEKQPERLTNVKIKDIPPQGYDLVIIDEAHHYPAPTWEEIVKHFSNIWQIFLTATPERKGKPILAIPPCYELKRSVAVDRGIIRNVEFEDTLDGNIDDHHRFAEIAKLIEAKLNKHDQVDPGVRHQGMVLAQTKQGINPAETFCDIYNKSFPNKCAVYVSETRRDILEMFVRGEIRVLVIIGRLLEGFDHNPVSVVGIVRNIAPTSRVLFAQFVGRAVRKSSLNDPVPAQIVTHKCFKQRQNFDTYEKLAEEEPNDDDN